MAYRWRHSCRRITNTHTHTHTHTYTCLSTWFFVIFAPASRRMRTMSFLPWAAALWRHEFPFCVRMCVCLCVRAHSINRHILFFFVILSIRSSHTHIQDIYTYIIYIYILKYWVHLCVCIGLWSSWSKIKKNVIFVACKIRWKKATLNVRACVCVCVRTCVQIKPSHFQICTRARCRHRRVHTGMHTHTGAYSVHTHTGIGVNHTHILHIYTHIICIYTT